MKPVTDLSDYRTSQETDEGFVDGPSDQRVQAIMDGLDTMGREALARFYRKQLRLTDGPDDAS